jgi:hypothetical protein
MLYCISASLTKKLDKKREKTDNRETETEDKNGKQKDCGL